MMHYPTVNDNADLEFLSTPQCKVRNYSYEFAVISKNKILRDFWETQSLKNGLNRRFWKKIASLWLRHLRFESLYLCQEKTDIRMGVCFFFDRRRWGFEESLLRAKRVTSFCQVFKVEICKANTTVTWQVDIICHHLGTFVFRGFFMPEYCF